MTRTQISPEVLAEYLEQGLTPREAVDRAILVAETEKAEKAALKEKKGKPLTERDERIARYVYERGIGPVTISKRAKMGLSGVYEALGLPWTPPPARRRWSAKRIADLKALSVSGDSLSSIAALCDCTEAAAAQKMRQQGMYETWEGVVFARAERETR